MRQSGAGRDGLTPVVLFTHGGHLINALGLAATARRQADEPNNPMVVVVVVPNLRERQSSVCRSPNADPQVLAIQCLRSAPERGFFAHLPQPYTFYLFGSPLVLRTDTSSDVYFVLADSREQVQTRRLGCGGDRDCANEVTSMDNVLKKADEQVAESIRQLSRATTAMAEAIDEGVGVIQRAVKRSGDAAEEFLDETTQRIKRHPTETIAATLAFGLAAGLLVGAFIGWTMRRR